MKHWFDLSTWTALFWSKVDQRGEDECWEWLGARTAIGYGRVSMPSAIADALGMTLKTQNAHRLAFLLSGGHIPPGMHIDHMCFNRSCCNPSHLRPLTHGENSAHRSPAALEAYVARGRISITATVKRGTRPPPKMWCDTHNVPRVRGRWPGRPWKTCCPECEKARHKKYYEAHRI